MNLRAFTDDIFQAVDPFIKAQPADQVMEPLVYCVRGDVTARLPVTPMFTLGAPGRTLVAQAIKSIAARLGMDAYLICAESYYLDETGTPDDAKQLQEDGIADDPRAKECIMMTAGDTSGTLVRIWEMHRGSDGRVVELVEREFPEGEKIEGRFHDLLKQTVH